MRFRTQKLLSATSGTESDRACRDTGWGVTCRPHWSGNWLAGYQPCLEGCAKSIWDSQLEPLASDPIVTFDSFVTSPHCDPLAFFRNLIPLHHMSP